MKRATTFFAKVDDLREMSTVTHDNKFCVCSWASISSDTVISCLILEGMIYFSVLQEGGVNSSARAYPMIVAIVTSRSVKRGILLSFENGAGDVVGC